MNKTHALVLLAGTLLASTASSQGPDLLYTTMQPEKTMSGSGGTSLEDLYPNEIVHLEFAAGCSGLSAEKWAPRTAFHTMAGDEDGDDSYWEPSLFGRIDAVMTTVPSNPIGIWNQRTVFYSPTQPMGTCVSGAPGLRPGDIGRIVRDTSGADGQVEHFLTAEDLQIALGLPPSPLVVNIDACAFGPNYGVFFSLENDTAVSTMCGITLVRDGDVLLIPAFALTYTGGTTIASVIPGSATVVYREPMVDLMVQNAQVADRNGTCVSQIIDVDALEIDWGNPFAFGLPTCWGITATIPHLLFAGRSLTGASVLNTVGGGTIHVSPCGPLGSTCGTGPTLGIQVGLRPPSGTLGVTSSINALCSTWVCRFVTESPAPQIPVFSPVQLDIASPGALTWVFFAFAPGGPCAVPVSSPFPWGLLCYPDYYAAPNFMGMVPTGSGFGTYTSPPVPWPVDLVWYGVTITGGSIEISTPTTVEIY